MIIEKNIKRPHIVSPNLRLLHQLQDTSCGKETASPAMYLARSGADESLWVLLVVKIISFSKNIDVYGTILPILLVTYWILI